MPEHDDKSVPGKWTSACLVVFGTALIGIAASANPRGQAIVSGIGILAGALVFARRPTWRPIFARALVLYATVLGFAVSFAMQSGWNKPFVPGLCPPNSSLEIDDAVIYCLMALPVFGIVGFTCFGIAQIAHQQAFFPVRSLRFAKGALFFFSIASLLGAIHRASRLPDPEKYVESLPILGSIAAPTGKPLRTLEKKVYMPSTIPETVEFEVYESALTADIVVRRYCDDSGMCSFMLRPSKADSKLDDQNLRNPAFTKAWQFLPQDCEQGSVQISRTDSVMIREDKQHALFFVDLVGLDTRYVVDARTFQFRAVPKKEILDATSVPHELIGMALLGLFIAIVLEIPRFRARNRLRLLANAPSGTLDADGWLVLENGSPPMRLGNMSAISPGPAILVRRDSSGPGSGPYRAGIIGDKDEVLFGTRDEILHRERWFLQSPMDSLSVTTQILSVVPLVTYWFVRGF